MTTNVQRLSESVIHVVDPGAIERDRRGQFIRSNCGIARLECNSGRLTTHTSLHMMVEELAGDLADGRPSIFAAEAPQSLPEESDWKKLFRARGGECLGARRNYPWSAPAGRAALLYSACEVPWVLRRAAERVTTAHGFMRWEDFCTSNGGLFACEAFVVTDTEASRLKENGIASAS